MGRGIWSVPEESYADQEREDVKEYTDDMSKRL